MPPSSRSADFLVRAWHQRGLLVRLLLPLGGLFFLLARWRRAAYRLGLFKSVRLPVPVVVIGNIIAGGAGKTPLTLWLAQQLRQAGRRPGIVSRGYGRAGAGLQEVGADGTASAVGDEPLLLARRSGCPVWVGGDRAAAAQALLAAHADCDLILCDDGLQHYRLERDVEIVVVDRRGLLNAWPQPAGPLREPAERLAEVDAVVLNGLSGLNGLNGAATPPLADVPLFHMRLAGDRFYPLDAAGVSRRPHEFAGLKLHAVAGIGEPQRFFDHLSALGLQFEAHAFPDHHRYASADFSFGGDALLMTEKDALKCAGLAVLPIWVLPVNAVIEPDLARFILEKIDGPTSA